MLYISRKMANKRERRLDKDRINKRRDREESPEKYKAMRQIVNVRLGNIGGRHIHTERQKHKNNERIKRKEEEKLSKMMKRRMNMIKLRN